MGSSSVTSSPTSYNHSMMVPSVTPMPHWGRRTSTIIGETSDEPVQTGCVLVQHLVCDLGVDALHGRGRELSGVAVPGRQARFVGKVGLEHDVVLELVEERQRRPLEPERAIEVLEPVLARQVGVGKLDVGSRA